MHVSICQIFDLTGRDRRTVAKQLRDLQYSAGERRTSMKCARAKVVVALI